MRKIRKVSVIEVKRAFLVSELVRRFNNKKDYLGKITKEQYKNKLTIAKKKILKLSENNLDKMIIKHHPKRLHALNTCNWYVGTFNPKEVGVWRRAGKLPLEWTNDSLIKTAELVSVAIKNKSKKLKSRAKFAITNILKTNVAIVQDEKYLYPIVFKGGTGTKGRKRIKKKMIGDIDDGCMRSIALTISGKKTIKAYLGFPIKNIKNKR